MRPGSSRAIKGRKPAWDRTEIVPEPAIYEVRAIGVKLSATRREGPPGHFTVKTPEAARHRGDRRLHLPKIETERNKNKIFQCFQGQIAASLWGATWTPISSG